MSKMSNPSNSASVNAGQNGRTDVSFYNITNCSHHSWLSVRLDDGQIRNTRSAEKEGYCPLIAIRLKHNPDIIFLTTDLPSTQNQPQLWLEHYTTKGVILSVGGKLRLQHLPPLDEDDLEKEQASIFAFEDLSRPGRHFTSRPLSDDEESNPIVGDCHHIFGWEEFTLTPIEGSPRLRQIAGDLEVFCHRGMTAQTLASLIMDYKGQNLLPALDALLPVIRWDELEYFGAMLLEQPALLAKLQNVTPPSNWLMHVFPALQQWEQARQAHYRSAGSQPACPPLPPAQIIESPVEDSFLANSGSDGSFAGFFQACIHGARKTIQPRRRVCLLTTLRNEGLYLLEWIAYHRSLGVEHFFIYSNDNSDKSDDLLRALAKEGLVTFVNNVTGKSYSPQFKAYGHALNVLPDILDFQWAFILDGDEFITLNTDRYKTIHDYLNWMEHWKTDGLAINWRFIASTMNFDGLKNLATPLTIRNDHIVGNGAIGEGWRLVKSACKPRHTLHSRPHHPVWNHMESFTFRLADTELHEYRSPPPGFPRDPAFADRGNFEHICISHFYFKSMTEWTWKHARNSGADAFQEISTERYTNQWANAFGMQLRDPQHEVNIWILKRQAAMMAELERLRAIPALRQAENAVRTVLNTQLRAIFERIGQEDISSHIDEEWRFILSDLAVELTGEIPLLPPLKE